MIDYTNIARPELITTKRIVEKELEEIDKELDTIVNTFCFITPDFDNIQFTKPKAEESYYRLEETKKYLKESLQTLNHKMAVFN